MNNSDDVLVTISANVDNQNRLRGINYLPGFAVAKPGDDVVFRTDDQGIALLIVFPNGSPFNLDQSVRFIVRAGAPVVRTVRQEAEKKRYKYIVGFKRGEDALLDGGCPEIFVDI